MIPTASSAAAWPATPEQRASPINWGLEREKAALDALQAGDSTVPMPTAMGQHKEWKSWSSLVERGF